MREPAVPGITAMAFMQFTPLSNCTFDRIAGSHLIARCYSDGFKKYFSPNSLDTIFYFDGSPYGISRE